MTQCYDIGHGITISPVLHSTSSTCEHVGHGCVQIMGCIPIGIMVAHLHDFGDGEGPRECYGYVPLCPCEKRAWTVEKADPLTLSPSILRKECGLHGFIREGRWVPA